jgi:hypothetical protein
VRDPSAAPSPQLRFRGLTHALVDRRPSPFPRSLLISPTCPALAILATPAKLRGLAGELRASSHRPTLLAASEETVSEGEGEAAAATGPSVAH